MKEQFILLSGNAVEGYCYTGPFVSARECVHYGDSYYNDGTWICAVLKPPLDETKTSD